jgi:hypothetical protein
MTRNQHRRTPLHHAAAKNRPAMVRLLLDLGADPRAADATGATALTTAAQENADANIVSMLEVAGAELDFIAALNLKRYDLAAAMLKEDPSRIGPNGRDTIVLHLSVSKRNVESLSSRAPCSSRSRSAVVVASCLTSAASPTSSGRSGCRDGNLASSVASERSDSVVSPFVRSSSPACGNGSRSRLTSVSSRTDRAPARCAAADGRQRPQRWTQYSR